MRLRIQDITAKPDWLAKVDGFLHDSSFRDRFAFDAVTSTFSLPLDRIGYEHARRQFGFLLLRYPTVPCSLLLAPVQVFSVDENADAWDFDDLVSISLLGPSHIELTTREAKVILYSGEPITLTLEDTGPPNERYTVTDVLFSICPKAVAAELVATSEA